MLYYDRLDIKSNHYAVRKGVVGREDIARFVRFILWNRTSRITVAYHRIAIECSNSATGVEIVKKERFRRGFVVVRFFR